MEEVTEEVTEGQCAVCDKRMPRAEAIACCECLAADGAGPLILCLTCMFGGHNPRHTFVQNPDKCGPGRVSMGKLRTSAEGRKYFVPKASERGLAFDAPINEPFDDKQNAGLKEAMFHVFDSQ